jgi:flagellar protein FliS
MNAADAQAYSSYRKAAVETISPGKLLLMLYDGAVKNLDTAQKAIADQDMNTAHQQLVKAQDIILELMATLNMDYEISKSLYSLYEYLHHQLVQANLKKDQQLIEEVRSFLVELRDAWDEAVKKSGPGKTQSPAPASVSGLNIKG